VLDGDWVTGQHHEGAADFAGRLREAAQQGNALTLIQRLASTADQLLDGDRETAAFPATGPTA